MKSIHPKIQEQVPSIIKIDQATVDNTTIANTIIQQDLAAFQANLQTNVPQMIDCYQSQQQQSY